MVGSFGTNIKTYFYFKGLIEHKGLQKDCQHGILYLESYTLILLIYRQYTQPTKVVTSPGFVVAPYQGFVGWFAFFLIFFFFFFPFEQDKWQGLPEKHTEALELNWLLHLGQKTFLLQSQ